MAQYQAAGVGGRAAVLLDTLADGARGGSANCPRVSALSAAIGGREGADRRINPIRATEVDRLEGGEHHDIVARRDATVALGWLDDGRADRRH